MFFVRNKPSTKTGKLFLLEQPDDRLGVVPDQGDGETPSSEGTTNEASGTYNL